MNSGGSLDPASLPNKNQGVRKSVTNQNPDQSQQPEGDNSGVVSPSDVVDNN